MGKFYLHAGTKLIATGVCPDGDEMLQGNGEYEVGLGDPPAEIAPDNALPRPTYSTLRECEYPKIGDQLDALWKLLGPGAAPGIEAGKMFASIQAVKAKYPKP